MVAGLAVHPQAAHAETWQEYLNRMWQDCENTFAALDKSTGLEAWDGTSSGRPAAGNGTADDPWQVTTPAEFHWVLHSAPLATRSLVLMNDLDMGSKPWVPARVATSGAVLIDGNGHTVYNLYMTGNTGVDYLGDGGMGLFAVVNNPSFEMRDLHFRFANIDGSTTMLNTVHYSVIVGYFIAGQMSNVSVEDSILRGNRQVGAIASGFSGVGRAVDNAGNKLDNPTGPIIDNCHTARVYVLANECGGNFAGPLCGATVTNSYAIDGVTVTTKGHSGGFFSCPGWTYAENAFCNVTIYGQSDTGVFLGVNHFSCGFKNCVAAGVVEGETNVGGFIGNAAVTVGNDTRPSQYENCYSTSMVGMQSSAVNMGGFAGIANGNLTFTNCYAAGEVGALKTVDNTGSVGGFIGNAAGAKFADCYYDKQTTAMGEHGWGSGTPVAAGGTGTITGKLTKELMGADALAALPGLSSGAWVAHSGVYPQLASLASPTAFAPALQNQVTACSMASVCTALLHPSDGDYPDATGYDTVRSITYLFPFTNDAMVDDGRFAISWEAGDDTSTVAGMEDIPVVSLKDDDSYQVASLAPGVGWTTVHVAYGDAVGSRQLRLVPTTAISVATAAGIDHTVYALPEGARAFDGTVHAVETSYDHRVDVKFSKGSAVDLADGNMQVEGFPADSEDFESVELTTVGGTVNVLVAKANADGEWVDAELTDSLKELLLGKRDATVDDAGRYRISYHWYANGAGGAYLESEKYLIVEETLTVTYYRNDEDLPRPTQQARTAAQAAPYHTDLGAYLAGDTVDSAYFPGGASAPAVPENPGYDFKGWADAADATAPNFDAATALAASTNVYGVWEPKARTATFDPNGGTLEGSTDPVEQGHYKALDAIEPPADPVRKGYEFVGWADTPNATAATLRDGDQLWDEDKNYYAVWTPVRAVPSDTVTVPTGGAAPDPSEVITNTDQLPDGTQVEWKVPPDTSKPGIVDAVLEVTYPDGTTTEVPVKVTVGTDAERHDPQPGTNVTVPTGGSVPDPSEVIGNAGELPDGTQFEWKVPPDPSRPGWQDAVVLVTYPDGSTEEVAVRVLVGSEDGADGDDEPGALGRELPRTGDGSATAAGLAGGGCIAAALAAACAGAALRRPARLRMRR